MKHFAFLPQQRMRVKHLSFFHLEEFETPTRVIGLEDECVGVSHVSESNPAHLLFWFQRPSPSCFICFPHEGNNSYLYKNRLYMPPHHRAIYKYPRSPTSYVSRMHKPVILHPSCHHKKDNAYADCLGPHTSIGAAYYSGLTPSGSQTTPQLYPAPYS
jgi:hypothetical protein